MDSLVTTAYDLLARPVFRRSLIFTDVATSMPTQLSHNGAVQQMNIVNDLDDSPATALLVEDFDVLPTPLASWKNSVILNEYGRAVTSTSLLRGTSMVPIDPIAAERVGRNQAATMDRLVLNTLIAAGGITNTGSAGSTPTDIHVAGSPSNGLRAASQYFKDNNVEPFEDGYYRAYLRPAAETALRKEADVAGWRYWQIMQESMGGSGNIAKGQVGGWGGPQKGEQGVYEGFRIIVSTGVGATAGIFCGRDAIAKGYSQAPGYGPMPQIVVAPVIDRLRRFASVGWYWLGGYARFRSEAVVIGDLAL